MAGIIDLQTAVQTAIGGVGVVPVLLGRKELHRNIVYPAYFLIPRGERYAVPQGPGASGNPRLLHTRRLTCEVHCWGANYNDAEDLLASFVTALRQALSGASYELNESSWEEPEDLNAGVVVAMLFTATLGLAQKTLPISVPFPATPPVVSDATAPTVVITSTGIDNTGAVAGDGVLTSGEG